MCLTHSDLSKSCSWSFVVIRVGVTTNYYPKSYAQISLVNSTLRSRKKGAIFTSWTMREFPITLWHVCKASQQLVPQQWICKARTEGII